MSETRQAACDCTLVTSVHGTIQVHREECPNACGCPVAQVDAAGKRVRYHEAACPRGATSDREPLP